MGVSKCHDGKCQGAAEKDSDSKNKLLLQSVFTKCLNIEQNNNQSRN